MANLYLSLIFATFVAHCWAQAPGDGSSYCLQEIIDGVQNPFFFTKPPYEKGIWPLMDSRDYMSLLLGEESVWQHVDADTNNTAGVATNVSQFLYAVSIYLYHYFMISVTNV